MSAWPLTHTHSTHKETHARLSQTHKRNIIEFLLHSQRHQRQTFEHTMMFFFCDCASEKKRDLTCVFVRGVCVCRTTIHNRACSVSHLHGPDPHAEGLGSAGDPADDLRLEVWLGAVLPDLLQDAVRDVVLVKVDQLLDEVRLACQQERTAYSASLSPSTLLYLVISQGSSGISSFLSISQVYLSLLPPTPANFFYLFHTPFCFC